MDEKDKSTEQDTRAKLIYESGKERGRKELAAELRALLQVDAAEED